MWKLQNSKKEGPHSGKEEYRLGKSGLLDIVRQTNVLLQIIKMAHGMKER